MLSFLLKNNELDRKLFFCTIVVKTCWQENRHQFSFLLLFIIEKFYF